MDSQSFCPKHPQVTHGSVAQVIVDTLQSSGVIDAVLSARTGFGSALPAQLLGAVPLQTSAVWVGTLFGNAPVRVCVALKSHVFSTRVLAIV